MDQKLHDRGTVQKFVARPTIDGGTGWGGRGACSADTLPHMNVLKHIYFGKNRRYGVRRSMYVCQR